MCDLFQAACREALDPEDQTLPIAKLEPAEKRMALHFHFETKNGYAADVEEQALDLIGLLQPPRMVNRKGNSLLQPGG